MSNDKNIQNLIEKLLSGDISSAESDLLEKYISQFPQYKELLTVHKRLSHTEFPIPDPDSESFSKMRADVLRRIRLNDQKSPGIFEEFFNRIKTNALRPEMAVAALTLIIGFLLGRALPPDQGTLTSNLMAKIRSLATENTSLQDVQRSPVTYSNVQFRDIDEKTVSINLDATTHLDFTGEKDDPLVRDIMAQTLLSSTNIGSELKAISYTRGIIDQKLKETLIFTLHNNPILATRLRAMSELSDYQNDNEIKEAFMKVLRDEESVKMRLFAMDYLTKIQVPPADLQQALDESKVTLSPAVMIKMRNYIDKN